MRVVQKSLSSVFFLKIVATPTGDMLSHTRIEATGDELVRQNTPLAGMEALRPVDEYETEPEIPRLFQRRQEEEAWLL